jgi:NAD(P)-dependent dehydrogenase (short-subunit alcohol dehydrogenase family)
MAEGSFVQSEGVEGEQGGDRMRNSVILITGATGALGSVVVQEFAQTEAQLALTSRTESGLAELARRADLLEKEVFFQAADLTDAEQVDELIQGIVSRFGRLDILLNTVGGWRGGNPVEATPLEDWNLMLAMNLQTAFLLSRAVLPYMLREEWGRIIHVSSRSALKPRGSIVGYAVSKMGVITLTEAIAAEVKGSGVTANVILPSTIDTQDNRRAMPKADHSKWVPPEHIAHTMHFLCTDAAAEINGARIPVYGAA